MSKSSVIRFGLATTIVAGAVAAYAPTCLAAESAASGKTTDVASKAPAESIMKITGTIEAADQNMFGQTTQVRIVSPDQGAFLIAKAGKGEELTDHVGETVTLMAHRDQDEKGNQVLSVDGYQVHEG